MTQLLPRWLPHDRLPRGAARVTADGSCKTGNREALGLSPSRGAGGWAAIVEHGSNGEVVLGQEPETTATRMELRAVLEGLRRLPAGTPVLVVTDALVVQQVHETWRRGDGPPTRAREKDAELWRGLFEEFRRLGHARFQYVRKRDMVSAHLRCHKIAGQEASRLAIELGQTTVNRTAHERAEQRERNRQLLARYREDDARRRSQVAHVRSGE